MAMASSADPLDLAALATGRHRLAREIAPMADGSTIALPINVLKGPVHGPRLVAVAGVHGDEHDGPAALYEVTDRIDVASLTGTLVIVPVANPPAFRVARRWNPADGVNMNRIFPADPVGSITHRLGAVLVEEIVRGADFVVSIHGWTTGSLTVPYVEYTAGHSTSDTARAGAAAFGLPYLEPLGLLPGRLMSLAAELGVAGCEVEIGGEGITLPERAAIGVRGVEGLLRHLGMLQGTSPATEGQRDVARAQLIAPLGGVLRQTRVRVGERVRGGDLLATIADLNGASIIDLRAPAGGVLAMRRHALPIEPGDLAGVVFTDLE
jgi:predicted deacylase